MSSPFIPNSFTYGDAPQGGVLMPMIIANRNPSNSIDKQYSAGYWWLSQLPAGSGNLYYQGGNSGGLPNWTLVANSGGALNTLSDGSTTVSPSGGNIAIVGTASQLLVTASAPTHELILSFPSAVTMPGSLTTTTTLTVGTNLTVNGTSTFTGGITFSGNVAVGGTLDVTGLTTLGALTQVGTLSLNASGTAATTIGGSSGAITIATGAGNFSLTGGGNSVSIAADAAANTVLLGSNNTTSSTHIQAGTGDLLLDGAATTQIIIGSTTQTGEIFLGRSTAGEDISIGSAVNASAQVISIGNGASAADSTVNILSGVGTAGAGVLALGNNQRVTTIGLGNVAPVASRTSTISGGTITTAVTDTLNLGTGGATTNAGATKTVNLNSGGVTLGSVLTNIATGAVTSGTHTTDIATGNRAAGTMALNLMTGTGTKTLNAGNADGLTTMNFLGVANINVSQNSNTAINTGTSTGTVGIGNSLAGAITVATGAGVGIDAVTASHFTITGAADLLLSSTLGEVDVTSGKTAATAITLTANGAGGGITMSADTGGILPTTSGKFTVISTDNAAQSIELHANGGIAETVRIRSDQGTSATSIDILSDVGGITLNSGLASASAINITSSDLGGGWTLNSGTAGVTLANTGKLSLAGAAASDITITGAFDLTLASTLGRAILQSGKAATDAIKLNASDAAGGITMIAGTGNINMTGNVLKSTNPTFLLNLAASQLNVTGTGTAYTLGTGATLTKIFDYGTNATTSGVFTAPVTGVYDLRSQITVTGTTIATTFVISIVTTARTYSQTFIRAASANDQAIAISALCDMTATDTAHVTIAVTGEGADTDDILGAATVETYFCGNLIG